MPARCCPLEASPILAVIPEVQLGPPEKMSSGRLEDLGDGTVRRTLTLPLEGAPGSFVISARGEPDKVERLDNVPVAVGYARIPPQDRIDLKELVPRSLPEGTEEFEQIVARVLAYIAAQMETGRVSYNLLKGVDIVASIQRAIEVNAMQDAADIEPEPRDVVIWETSTEGVPSGVYVKFRAGAPVQ